METRRFTDPNIAAYFKSHRKKKYKVTPVRLSDGRVGFDIEGQNVDDTLQEIYQNKSVLILDYLQSLKTLRSSIFALKGENR